MATGQKNVYAPHEVPIGQHDAARSLPSESAVHATGNPANRRALRA